MNKLSSNKSGIESGRSARSNSARSINRLAGSWSLSARMMGAVLGGMLASFALPAAFAQDGVDIPVPEVTPGEETFDFAADGAAPIVNVTVNSSADGLVTPDDALTLREAIEITNGTLPLSALSPAESALVSPAGSPAIGFALVGGTDIELVDNLPAIAASGLLLDGTTQSGYGEINDEPAAVPVPIPTVSISPAGDAEVFRGLTIIADDVTVRGLSLHGFSSSHTRTASTPPADIFISNVDLPQGNNTRYRRGVRRPSARTVRVTSREVDQAPNGIVIEDNWLGVPPSGVIPEPAEMSAFGVSVFNGTNTTVQRNRIGFHESSGIITGNIAQGLVVTENTLIGNGLAGLPSAVYLAGDIDGSEVFGNLVCANDGSGVAMFKPNGSARIFSNDIRFNGRRFRSPGISLMGSGHDVSDNYVAFQPGPGVGIVAYPKSQQNTVRGNFFRQVDGLSVDLNYNHNTRVSDYQFNDGPNPPRNSNQRRRDSANAAINAPEFDEYMFPITGNTVTLTGRADPGSEVDIYSVSTKPNRHYGNLGNLLTTVPVGDDGTFSATVDASDVLPEAGVREIEQSGSGLTKQVVMGSEVAAIATDTRYGTSEPSPVAAIGSEPPFSPPTPYTPVCQDPPLEAEVVALPPDEPIALTIPRNIHFALDRSFISAESATIMDQIASAMAEYPSLTVELQGHTDPRASDEYNQALGERRAVAARDYMLQKGIAPERMRIRSFGETQLISNAPDIVDYARDRRVEFIFSDTRGLDIVFERQESDLQIE
ncbi:MAG: OmpA family protein [Cyanobacteria bacterium J06560_2]